MRFLFCLLFITSYSVRANRHRLDIARHFAVTSNACSNKIENGDVQAVADCCSSQVTNEDTELAPKSLLASLQGMAFSAAVENTDESGQALAGMSAPLIGRALAKLAGGLFKGAGATVGGAAGLAAACVIEQMVIFTGAQLLGTPAQRVTNMTVSQLRHEIEGAVSRSILKLRSEELTSVTRGILEQMGGSAWTISEETLKIFHRQLMDKELKMFGSGLKNVADVPAYAQLAAVHSVVLQELAKVEAAKSNSTSEPEVFPPVAPSMGQWCGESARVARHYKSKLSAKKSEWIDWRVDRLQVQTKGGMLKIVDEGQTGANEGSWFSMGLWSSSDKKLAEDACLTGGKVTLGHKLLKDVDGVLEAMDKVVALATETSCHFPPMCGMDPEKASEQLLVAVSAPSMPAGISRRGKVLMGGQDMSDCSKIPQLLKKCASPTYCTRVATEDVFWDFYGNGTDFKLKEESICVLHRAALRCPEQLPELLAEVSQQDLNMQLKPSGHTPLMMAIAYKKWDSALRLLEAGASIELIDTEGKNSHDWLNSVLTMEDRTEYAISADDEAAEMSVRTMVQVIESVRSVPCAKSSCKTIPKSMPLS